MGIEDDETREVDTGMDIVLRHAHAASFCNKKDVIKSKKCGCFHCLEIFDAGSVRDYVTDRDGKTAMCPSCCTDAVLADASGFPITKDFMREMKKAWF